MKSGIDSFTKKQLLNDLMADGDTVGIAKDLQRIIEQQGNKKDPMLSYIRNAVDIIWKGEELLELVDDYNPGTRRNKTKVALMKRKIVSWGKRSHFLSDEDEFDPESFPFEDAGEVKWHFYEPIYDFIQGVYEELDEEIRGYLN